jgi:hypothetical protein
MAQSSLEDRTAEILAAVVAMWRGHGVADDQLVAAGGRGLATALEEHAREVTRDGICFELRCSQAITAAILETLPKPEPLGIALCRGNFALETRARAAKIRRKLAAVRERYTAEMERPADKLSVHALAVFDLYSERVDQIDERLQTVLQGDETARRIAPPDEDGVIDFYVDVLELPEAGEEWTIVLGFFDHDSCAHVDLDGWTVRQVVWSH